MCHRLRDAINIVVVYFEILLTSFLFVCLPLSLFACPVTILCHHLTSRMCSCLYTVLAFRCLSWATMRSVSFLNQVMYFAWFCTKSTQTLDSCTCMFSSAESLPPQLRRLEHLTTLVRFYMFFLSNGWTQDIANNPMQHFSFKWAALCLCIDLESHLLCLGKVWQVGDARGCLLGRFAGSWTRWWTWLHSTCPTQG